MTMGSVCWMLLGALLASEPALAGPSQAQADMFLRDFDGLVSAGPTNIGSMPLRKQHQAKVDELERRAEKIFGHPLTSELGACTAAATGLATIWTNQMVIVGSPGVSAFNVASLAQTSIMVGQRRSECGDAIEQLSTTGKR